MSLNLITIIIPTYKNRHNYLKRILEYYNTFDYTPKIIIADSGSSDIYNSYLTKLLNNNYIMHLKFPADIAPINKIREALNLVESKYVVICGDDDFIVPNAMERSIDFMENNYDYSCAHGRYIVFKYLAQDEVMKLNWQFGYQSISISDDDATERLSEHLLHYEPTFYAVHRSNQLKIVFHEAAKLPFDDRFGEIYPTALTSIMGKIKILNILYCAREFNRNSAGQNMLTWYDLMTEKNYKDKYNSIINCLARYLSDQSHISFAVAEQNVDMILKTFIFKSTGKHSMWRVNYSLYDKTYKIIRLILKKAGLVRHIYKILNMYKLQRTDNVDDEYCNRMLKELINPSSQFYNDYIKIEQSVLNNPCQG